ncbi:hypothetical protein E3N88_07335 [Mikania micrantha]|uniref:Uncharacterized protein n=1 Tax=Mikania micrantha TaxID=192012 RepID=A0A5N6PU50_9ASTR|nr:hypothetical protein E3N88_07335 [Mikania micrantha]
MVQLTEPGNRDGSQNKGYLFGDYPGFSSPKPQADPPLVIERGEGAPAGAGEAKRKDEKTKKSAKKLDFEDDYNKHYRLPTPQTKSKFVPKIVEFTFPAKLKMSTNIGNATWWNVPKGQGERRWEKPRFQPHFTSRGGPFQPWFEAPRNSVADSEVKLPLLTKTSSEILATENMKSVKPTPFKARATEEHGKILRDKIGHQNGTMEAIADAKDGARESIRVTQEKWVLHPSFPEQKIIVEGQLDDETKGRSLVVGSNLSGLLHSGLCSRCTSSMIHLLLYHDRIGNPGLVLYLLYYPRLQ